VTLTEVAETISRNTATAANIPSFNILMLGTRLPEIACHVYKGDPLPHMRPDQKEVT